ncbi:MAG: DUF1465 family protein, partial [Pseudomonadota bacterium]
MAKTTPIKEANGPDMTFTEGKVFEKVFTDGMALVEETAAYLDGPGRKLSQTLPR